VPRSVSRACALPLTGACQKRRVEEKISSFEERGGYVLLFMLWVPETRTGSLILTLKIPPLSSIEQSVEECYGVLYVSSKDLMKGFEKRLLYQLV